MLVIIVDNTIVVHVFVFHIPRAYFRELLLRTICDICLIAEITDCFQTKYLSDS